MKTIFINNVKNCRNTVLYEIIQLTNIFLFYDKHQIVTTLELIVTKHDKTRIQHVEMMFFESKSVLHTEASYTKCRSKGRIYSVNDGIK